MGAQPDAATYAAGTIYEPRSAHVGLLVLAQAAGAVAVVWDPLSVWVPPERFGVDDDDDDDFGLGFGVCCRIL